MDNIKDSFKEKKRYVYECSEDSFEGMRVPARAIVSPAMMKDVGRDRSLLQLINTSMLPGVCKYVLAMPDMHEGYGFPIGGVAATKLPHGVISPGGVGYDINCGVRMLRSDLTFEDTKSRLQELAMQMMRAVPSGTGRGGRIVLKEKDMDRVLNTGSEWCIKNGIGNKDDLLHLEENGRLKNADAASVSQTAKRRGSDQLGTLGSGNHFLEVQRVDQIFDPDAAEKYHLFPNQVVILIHCGSRGLGHQVCTDYVRTMLQKLPTYGFSLPDKQLACAPADSKEGEEYLKAMAAAANYAWANRTAIAHHVRIEWELIFGAKNSLYTLYDVCHNIAKKETHNIDGKPTEVLVHRKGATRAFGPGLQEVPEDYRSVGQPVLIPGSMGTASYILKGTKKAMDETFGTVCHGAGRAMSRSEAKRRVSGQELRTRLNSKGIIVECFSNKGLAEEAPEAYKDIELVVDVVHNLGLATKVARLKPIAVIKGG